MAVFFTSDQHYGHPKVIKYCRRPFHKNFFHWLWMKLTGRVTQASVEYMNRELIRRHNEVVRPSDTVLHLGDFSLNHNRMKEILPKLNGEHHLIMGNHDRCHPANGVAKGKKMEQFYLDAGFKTVLRELTIELAGVDVDLCHLPYATEESLKLNQKWLKFRPINKGRILLHGHVHESWKILGHMINVGVDVWDFRPVSQ